ncbi:hypothetical protein B0T10DRAFT_292308 [Thelonectria olida]|uniref:Uncharacterized protein n=1 Tax=Thelonectria olida TaxID=1576542 RepID=A0A9P9ANP1_9HYPO|nr:hypothetical protein B0T10DRAFT_292308 [Thelonectria olida]
MQFINILASAAVLFTTTAMAATPVPPVSTPIATSVYTVSTTYTSDYVFYCPTATVFTHKNATYTATSATWLTITNCPCTVTYTSNPYGTASPVVSTITNNGVAATVTYPPTLVNTVPPVVSSNFPTGARPTTGSGSGSSATDAPIQTAGADTYTFNTGLGALVAVGLAALAL